jgi:hypothetical protein
VAEVIPAVHFVGFRGDEYWCMRREAHATDTIVFADDSKARPSDQNGNDLNELPDLYESDSDMRSAMLPNRQY